MRQCVESVMIEDDGIGLAVFESVLKRVSAKQNRQGHGDSADGIDGHVRNGDLCALRQ